MEWGKGDESKDNPATQRELDRIDTAFNDVTVVQTLRTVDRWDFDIFTLAGHSLVGDSPLLIITTHLFNSLGLFEKFSIPLPNFANFISRIERGYKNNAYHNRLHAADVVQNMFFFLRTPSFSEKISPLDVFAALIAAAVHDVGHPGMFGLTCSQCFHARAWSKLSSWGLSFCRHEQRVPDPHEFRARHRVQ